MIRVRVSGYFIARRAAETVSMPSTISTPLFMTSRTRTIGFDGFI
jgi:hypothetical protein